MGIKHTKHSVIADAVDTTRVRPSDWNADHVIDGDVDFGGHMITNAVIPGGGGGGGSTESGFSEPGLWYDIRDYGTVVSGGDITTALQATITAANAANGPRRILIPHMGGTQTLGAITFSGNGWIIEIQQQNLNFTATFNMPSNALLRGMSIEGGGQILQQPPPAPIINATGSANPLIYCHNATDWKIEGLALGGGGVALKLLGCSVCTIERCIIGSNGMTSADIPLSVDATFWLNIRDCLLQFGNGNTTAYCAEFLSSGTGGDPTAGTGLVNVKNLLLDNGGIHISPTNGPTPAGSFFFEDVYNENLTSGKSLFDFDSSSSNIRGPITITRPGIADTSGVYYIKNTGGATSSVILDVYTDNTDTILDPTSSQINGLSVLHATGQPSSGLIYPTYNYLYGVEAQDVIDKRLITAPRGPQVVIGTVMNVEQNPLNWSGGTITTGVLAPDGSTNAGTITSGTFTGPEVLSGFGTAVSVGDWFIVGCWVRCPAGFGNNPSDGLPLFDFSDWNSPGPSTGAQLNGSTILGQRVGRSFGTLEPFNQTGTWQFFCQAFKCTGVGTGTVNLKLQLSRDNGSNLFSYFAPCVQWIKVASGWTDYDVMNAARSYRGSWSTNSTAADVGILDHQYLRAAKFKTSSAGLIADANANELIKFPATVASATNELTISNAVNGSAPSIAATGSSDTNINLNLTPKGTGAVVSSGPVKTLSTVVGSLPSASGAGSGARAFVTDATVTTFATTVAGGGANKVPVVSDGTNWIIG